MSNNRNNYKHKLINLKKQQQTINNIIKMKQIKWNNNLKNKLIK